MEYFDNKIFKKEFGFGSNASYDVSFNYDDSNIIAEMKDLKFIDSNTIKLENIYKYCECYNDISNSYHSGHDPTIKDINNKLELYNNYLSNIRLSFSLYIDDKLYYYDKYISDLFDNSYKINILKMNLYNKNEINFQKFQDIKFDFTDGNYNRYNEKPKSTNYMFKIDYSFAIYIINYVPEIIKTYKDYLSDNNCNGNLSKFNRNTIYNNLYIDSLKLLESLNKVGIPISDIYKIKDNYNEIQNTLINGPLIFIHIPKQFNSIINTKNYILYVSPQLRQYNENYSIGTDSIINENINFNKKDIKFIL